MEIITNVIIGIVAIIAICAFVFSLNNKKQEETKEIYELGNLKVSSQLKKSFSNLKCYEGKEFLKVTNAPPKQKIDKINLGKYEDNCNAFCEMDELRFENGRIYLCL